MEEPDSFLSHTDLHTGKQTVRTVVSGKSYLLWIDAGHLAQMANASTNGSVPRVVDEMFQHAYDQIATGDFNIH